MGIHLGAFSSVGRHHSIQTYVRSNTCLKQILHKMGKGSGAKGVSDSNSDPWKNPEDTEFKVILLELFNIFNILIYLFL
ncbi:MAG: hypothetical protein C6W57_04695 [Caldibacillus debilis]|nr:MAG: hypothetical protein C6W57_04695 [Caldibacillus debilis]